MGSYIWQFKEMEVVKFSIFLVISIEIFEHTINMLPSRDRDLKKVDYTSPIKTHRNQIKNT